MANKPTEISLVDFPSYRWGGGPKVTMIHQPTKPPRLKRRRAHVRNPEGGFCPGCDDELDWTPPA